jgi:hypothetical protein
VKSETNIEQSDILVVIGRSRVPLEPRDFDKGGHVIQLAGVYP